MVKNEFGNKLQNLLIATGTKKSTLAKSVQYDLSYVSKWVSGKMLPSEKNIDRVIEDITSCLMSGELSKLTALYGCKSEDIAAIIHSELEESYLLCRPKITEDQVQAICPTCEVVEELDHMILESDDTLALIDILELPHESRLILAGIRDNRFCSKKQKGVYHMIISADSNEPVYDSIFLIHMLTGYSGINFKLYNDSAAKGKIVYCVSDSALSAMLLPGGQDCLAVTKISDGIGIRQRLSSYLNQENLIFRMSTLQDMIHNMEYIQTMLSLNIRWVLGHITELLLPKPIYMELTATDDRDTTEYARLYELGRNVIYKGSARIMIYESAIAALAMDGIVDFYNRPVKLTADQVLSCIQEYKEMITEGAQIKMIEEGFSDDFRYITNPCMFLSESISYLRLENKRYTDNIMILNDRSSRTLFRQFFETVWTDRQDVVVSNPEAMILILDKYKESVRILLGET